jgi:hypothetical protein
MLYQIFSGRWIDLGEVKEIWASERQVSEDDRCAAVGIRLCGDIVRLEFCNSLEDAARYRDELGREAAKFQMPQAELNLGTETPYEETEMNSLAMTAVTLVDRIDPSPPTMKFREWT